MLWNSVAGRRCALVGRMIVLAWVGGPGTLASPPGPPLSLTLEQRVAAQRAIAGGGSESETDA